MFKKEKKESKKKLQDNFLYRLTNRLTNHQKYYAMIFIVVFGFFLVIWGLVVEMNSQISLINQEIWGNRLEEPLRKLHENVDRHFSLSRKYILGDKTLRNEIRKVQTVVQQDMRTLLLLQDDFDSLRLQEGRAFLSQNNDPIRLVDLERQWNRLQEEVFKSGVDKNHQNHISLLANLNGMIKQLEEMINPDSNLAMSSFFLTEIINYYFPDLLQENELLNHKIENISSNEPITQEQKLAVINHLIPAKSSYLSINNLVEKAIMELEELEKYSEIKRELQFNFSQYESALERYFYLIEQMLANGQKVEGVNYRKEGEAVLSTSFDFWKSSEKNLENILAVRRRLIVPWKYILLGAALFTALIGFVLGKFFVRTVITSIHRLDFGFKRLNEGDLSVRVPVQFQDEIGRASQGFNKMAEKFEKLITQQRELFEATKHLAEGDFSTRVAVDQEDEEIRKLTESFNYMAESIEKIIKQVGRLGINLTESSNEIAEASKKHEASTNEQEKTTEEILSISSKISEKAKDFAKTINDVTVVVDQSSSLATKGRESLTVMENIMRQMVDASIDIAAKLGVLSEKAGNINQVITTITNVADQTNLLSLNAAITADKAEEYGRSFSVIAGEIRGLADQTALATLDIEKIIDEMMSSVSACVMGVDDFIQEIRTGVEQNQKVGEQLAQIIEQVQALAPRFELVNDGMQLQYDASTQINDAIMKLSKTTHKTAESMHQFTITTNELSESAVYLKNALSKIVASRG